MRISLTGLQAVRRAGMLTRYAVMGPVVLVLADLPADGTDGTGLEERCVTDHHGLVSRGTLTVRFEDGRSEAFETGTAFYVPPGPVGHRFESSPDCVVVGFAPVTPELDTRPETLRSRGFTVIAQAPPPVALPSNVRLPQAVDSFRRRGSIEVDGGLMGNWIFMRSIFGPRSGYTGGWCDLPHWGLVLEGEIAIAYEEDVELISAGDAFYAGPGHRFQAPEGATVIDYTPIEASIGARAAAWRRTALTATLAPEQSAGPAPDGDDVDTKRADDGQPVLELGTLPAPR